LSEGIPRATRRAHRWRCRPLKILRPTAASSILNCRNVVRRTLTRRTRSAGPGAKPGWTKLPTARRQRNVLHAFSACLPSRQ
jgi:hypothetical protein